MHIHSDILEKIGTNRYIAKHFELPPQRVAMWKQQGIPHKFRPAVEALADFNMPEGFIVR
tara:strand:- start:404 stop:583 length:180 start_codon:yes stop_codon:yes gene_type:complete